MWQRYNIHQVPPQKNFKLIFHLTVQDCIHSVIFLAFAADVSCELPQLLEQLLLQTTRFNYTIGLRIRKAFDYTSFLMNTFQDFNHSVHLVCFEMISDDGEEKELMANGPDSLITVAVKSLIFQLVKIWQKCWRRE